MISIRHRWDNIFNCVLLGIYQLKIRIYKEQTSKNRFFYSVPAFCIHWFSYRIYNHLNTFEVQAILVLCKKTCRKQVLDCLLCTVYFLSSAEVYICLLMNMSKVYSIEVECALLKSPKRASLYVAMNSEKYKYFIFRRCRQ